MYLLRGYLNHPKPPQSPSQKVLGALGHSMCLEPFRQVILGELTGGFWAPNLVSKRFWEGPGDSNMVEF